MHGLIDFDFDFQFNKDIHRYNTRQKDNVHLVEAKRNWPG
jgi:hypothetical protein